MTEKRQRAAFGIIDPEGKLTSWSADSEDGLFKVVAALMGMDEAIVKKRLTKAGWRSVPVIIVEVV